jgi:hypothetical protein
LITLRASFLSKPFALLCARTLRFMNIPACLLISTFMTGA